jgi:hypothetical protein
MDPYWSLSTSAIPALSPPAAPARDRRWVTAVVLIGVLTSAGVAVANWVGLSGSATFSANVSFVYCPVAAVLMLFLGWTAHGFPIAAALFYGFLPICQAAAYFFVGDEQTGLGLEVLLALPVLITGFLGPSGRAPGHDRPAGKLSLAWVLVLVSAVISTILAQAPEYAVGTLAGRFVVPILVTLAVARRLRDVEDYRVIWYGLAAGFVLISIYDVRRVIYGTQVSAWYVREIDQRFVGATGSFAIGCMSTIGGALWYGYALALRRNLGLGLSWLSFALLLGVLFGLGGHRGPVVFFGLLVLAWVPGHVLRDSFRGKGLLVTGLIAVAMIGMTSAILSRSHISFELLWERLSELGSHGLTGESRWFLWMEGLDYWTTSPLTGLGLNNWAAMKTGFASVHGSIAGVLLDMGLLGALAFSMLFVGTLRLTRKSRLAALDPVQQELVLGCRAGWVITLGLLAVNLPFTSGQMFNTIFNYVLYFFPLLAMVVAARHPVPTVAWPVVGAPQAMPRGLSTMPASLASSATALTSAPGGPGSIRAPGIRD